MTYDPWDDIDEHAGQNDWYRWLTDELRLAHGADVSEIATLMPAVWRQPNFQKKLRMLVRDANGDCSQLLSFVHAAPLL